MATDLSTDPRLDALLATTTRTSPPPGMPFEIVEEDVLGERLKVFRNRSHSIRDVLLGADARTATATATCSATAPASTSTSWSTRSRRSRARLRERHGIGPGDRVAVCAANCREWLLTFWAVASLDAVLVAMNGWWTGAEMRNALELTDPKLLVMDEKRHARLDGDPGRSPAARHRARLRRAGRRPRRRRCPTRRSPRTTRSSSSSPAGPPAGRRPRCSRTAPSSPTSWSSRSSPPAAWRWPA